MSYWYFLNSEFSGLEMSTSSRSNCTFASVSKFKSGGLTCFCTFLIDCLASSHKEQCPDLEYKVKVFTRRRSNADAFMCKYQNMVVDP